MDMKIAVLMATMRWQNWPLIRRNLEDARNAGGDFQWVPAIYPSEWADVPEAARAVLQAAWITPVIIEPSAAGFHPVLHKVNTALDWIGDHANHAATWCFFGADDDLVPKSFGLRLQGAADAEARAIVTSCARGQRAVLSGYPTWPLIAAPGNMVPCAVTGSQVTVRYDAFAGLRFRPHMQGDGEMIGWLHAKMPGAFRYLPDYYVPFNALEGRGTPGSRWDEDKLAEILNQP